MAQEMASSFLGLPSELIHLILSFLPLSDLQSLGRVNRTLQEHSRQDALYQPFVQSHVPGSTVPKLAGLSWRDLFKHHYPYWFIPKNKIWFADNLHTGKLLIARYDYRLNAIEAYALVAERRQPTFQTWDWNPEAIIHTFSPRVQLDLNAPVLRLDATAYENAAKEGESRLQGEVDMNLFIQSSHSSAGLYSRLMLAKPWPAHLTTAATNIWPPLVLPSPLRTRNDSPSNFRDLHHRPRAFSELSTSNFRLRRWMEFSPRLHGVNMRVGEEITTWATLPAECYTPTPQKPWQGIWCGDYAGHGCEFLVVIQPDNPMPLPERAEWAIRAREQDDIVSGGSSQEELQYAAEGATVNGMTHSSVAHLATQDSGTTSESTTTGPSSFSYMGTREDETIHQGRLEAIKLTGDPNIPRGEYTFIAPDIGPGGLIRVATEDLFKGARIVKSVGHMAATGFTDDDYISSQLILISHDRMAQYWETFGHVSFYQRVDIDRFTQIP